MYISLNRPTFLFASIFSLSIIFITTDAVSGESSKAPLAVAKSLANEKYRDWKYGSNTANQEIDCVQFLVAVIEELENMSLGNDTRARILISDISQDTLKADDYKIVRENDPRIRGVQTALPDLDRGTLASLAEAKPGDFVQYWMKKNNGTWFGHAGVLNEVKVNSDGVRIATIFGAHASGSVSGQTCGVSNFKLRLIDSDDRRIYIVRYMPEE